MTPTKTPVHSSRMLAEDKLIAFLFFSTVCLLFTVTLSDPDLPWHLKTGEFILKTRQIPTQDPFSFAENSVTFLGRFLLSQYWLAQVVLMGLYSMFGTGGLVIITALIFTLIAFTLWSLIREKNFLFSLIIIGGYTMYFLYGFNDLRPQTFTFILTVLLIWLVEKFKETSSTIYIWPLPLIMLIWANMHGGFIFGLVILTLYTISDFISLNYRILSTDTVSKIHFRILSIVVTLSFIASFLNPNGLSAFIYAFNTHSTDIFNDILEYQSPFKVNYVSSQIMLQYWLAIPLSLTCLVLSLKDRKPWPVLIILLTVAMSFTAIRYFPLMVLATTAALRHIPFKVDTLFPHKRPVIVNTLIVLTMLGGLSISLLHINKRTFQYSETLFNPQGAINFLKQNKISGNVFGSYNKSGYLIWGLYPDSQVFWSSIFFSYDRFKDGNLIEGADISERSFIKLLCRLIPEDIGKVRVNDVSNGDDTNYISWQERINQSGSDIVVHEAINVISGKPIPLVFMLMLKEEWKLVYLDGNVVILLKDLPKFKKQISLFEKSKYLFFDELIAEGERRLFSDSAYFPAIAALGYILKGNSGVYINELIQNALILNPNNEIVQFVQLLYGLQNIPPDKRTLNLNISQIQ